MQNSQNLGTHFNNIFHMMDGLPQGHEKPLKHALYNAVALFLLFACCAVGFALFLVLDPFFKPLLWALLVGSLLHPIKYSIATQMTKWFQKIEKTNRPLIVGIATIPYDILNEISKHTSSAIQKYYKIAGCLILSAVTLVWIIHWFPWRYFSYTWEVAKMFNVIIKMLLTVCNTFTFISLSIGYVILIAVMWNKEREDIFRKTSFLVWICVSSYISHLTGSLQGITFVLLQFVALVGFVLQVITICNQAEGRGKKMSYFNAAKLTLSNKDNFENAQEIIDDKNCEILPTTSAIGVKPTSTIPDPVKSSSKLVDTTFPARSRAGFQTRTLSALPLSTPESKSAIESHIVAALQRKALSTDMSGDMKTFKPMIITNGESESMICFKFLLWACGAMVLWKHPWMWPLILIILALFAIKTTGRFFGVWNFIGNYISEAAKNIKCWCDLRYSALVPAHMQGIIKILVKVNQTVHDAAKDSIDAVSSAIVIFGLILFLTCAPIFMGVQIYSEGITVVQLTGSLINRTVVHNPELRQLLPPGLDDTIDSLLDNAYLYGREGLSKAIKGVLEDSDSEKSAKIEKQLLELWDRVYQAWMSNNDVGPQVNADAIEQSWKSFVDDITKTPGMFNTSGLLDFAKQNVGTLLSLLDSLWSLFKGNITLVLGSLSAITSVLLGGSSAVLNFILGLVVFFTTLFYLLNSSNVLYKPIEMISSFSPINGSRFGLALTDAVNGVFKATLKMAAFYGLWTWLIHNLFGAKIVYLPSALAAMLAAVPFLGTYLACVPAVLDLWLAQGRPILAILLAVCQFAPASYVDTIIYKEIKNGGHPYFTGLAIAGGIFCLGVEGAIFGPLLLCFLLVALNLSSSLFKETPLEERSTASTLQARLGLGHFT